MRLRTRLLLSGAGVAGLGSVVLCAVLLLLLRNAYLGEVTLRARTLLELLSVETAHFLGATRIEELDQAIANLVERDIGTLDIQYVAVLDSSRRVVGHTRQSEYGRVADDPFSMEVAAGEAFIARSVDTEEGPMLLAGLPVRTAVPGLPGIRWGSVVVGIGLDRVNRGITHVLLLTVGIIVTGLLLAGALSFPVLHRLLVAPVQRLTRDAQRFAGGDLKTRTDVRTTDETGMLGTAFNDMAARIEHYTRGLEDEIRARTHEIEEANRQLAIANATLQGLATTDGLTGLFNYRHFMATLSSEVQRSRRVHRPVSMLMVDVDHFKDFNDRNGHPAGDETLRQIARHVQSRLRRTDVPCRYGGEEFAVILVDTGEEDALRVAEELRDLIERSVFPGEATQPGGRLTVSVGVATFPDEATGPDELVRAADKALYKAKEAGRNRVDRPKSEVTGTLL